MAKQPETQERYLIHAHDIEMEALGVVLAALARLGITHVTYELVTDILAYRHKAAPRVVHDVPALDIARTFISQHHTFKARELITVFEQDGRSSALGYATIKKLVGMGELRKLDEAGHYQSTQVKALEAPAAEAEPDTAPAKPNGRGTRYAVSNIDVVWSAIHRRKTVTRAEIVDIMVENDRPKISVDGLVGKLKEVGRLKSLSTGKYEVIKPAKEE